MDKDQKKNKKMDIFDHVKMNLCTYQKKKRNKIKRQTSVGKIPAAYNM